MAKASKSNKINLPVKEHEHYCVGCGKTKTSRYFYKSNSPKYDNDKFYNRPPYCKECIKDKVYQKSTGLPDKQAFKDCLRDIFDMPFYNDLYLSVLDSKKELVGEYLRRLNLTNNNFKATWENGETDDENNKNNNKLSDTSVDVLKINNVITDEDLKVEKDVIKLLGYNPFDGYDTFDKKFLNGELLPYLDEDTLDDQFKTSVIIQIVNNNNQIRKIDLVVNQMSGDSKSLIKNSNDIKNLTTIKTQLTQANDKLSKENSISVKNRGDKSAGKSTLTYMMKNYRELGFEEAEQDYYDQNKARGMKIVADLSNKSILEQLQFDENDYNDMLIQQRQLIQELQVKVDELEEDNRQLYEKLGKFTKIGLDSDNHG